MIRPAAPSLRTVGAYVQFDTPRHRVVTIKKILYPIDITDMLSQTASKTTTDGVDVYDSNLDGRVGSENYRIWAPIKR